ncbi:MAG: RnfABCDGE type electron transport complex subunit B [Oscillospiraceae bacterium]|jgi:RnfABCDGE-type electron transport complex B subunit|nr:RnfABCDGE type electron transport complex subunit B [Oscillospiraceae bacterium]
MSSILFAVAVVAGIGLVAGVGLAVASAVMRVPVDERVEKLAAALPGANCGACGYAGCAGYAEAVAAGGAANLCTPGGDGVARALAGIMGVEPQAVAPRKALVRCNGTRRNCKQSFEYHGEQSCAAACLLYSGQKQCNYGCLGFGDCAAACPHGAIYFEDGVARMDQEKCVGCSLCAAACPKHIIVMKETVGKAINRCCSEAPGAVARKQCAAACIGCRLCARNCPEQAIAVENNLAHVDPEKCVGCGLCISKCPTKSLVMS